MSDEPQGDTTQAIDLEAALERIPGGLAAVKQMAQVLVAECPRLLEEIRAGVAAGDAARVKRGAHTMKGSADVFAARRVVAAARRLEAIARDGQLESAPQVLVELEAEVAGMIDAIRFTTDSP